MTPQVVTRPCVVDSPIDSESLLGLGLTDLSSEPIPGPSTSQNDITKSRSKVNITKNYCKD